MMKQASIPTNVTGAQRSFQLSRNLKDITSHVTMTSVPIVERQRLHLLLQSYIMNMLKNILETFIFVPSVTNHSSMRKTSMITRGRTMLILSNVVCVMKPFQMPVIVKDM